MSEEIHIGLEISGRKFYLNVKRNEEELYRKAAALVTKCSDQYTDCYSNYDGLRYVDPEDLFRITAFHFALENLKLKEQDPHVQPKDTSKN